MMKDSVIIYREWKEALSELDMVERCQAYEAIMDYAFEGKIPQNKLIKSITALMRQRIDKDQERYKETCNKRAEAGRLGGLKKASNKHLAKDSKCYQLPANANDAKQSYQKLANVADYDYVYDNDIIPTNVGDNNTRAREFELKIKSIVADYMSRNQISIEAFCKNENLTPEKFKESAYSLLTEWSLKGWNPELLQDGNDEFQINHFINTIRKINKGNKGNNGSQQQDRFQQRRGSETNAISAKDYDEPL